MLNRLVTRHIVGTEFARLFRGTSVLDKCDMGRLSLKRGSHDLLLYSYSAYKDMMSFNPTL